VKFAAGAPAPSDKITGARLYNPAQDKNSLLALLVEPEDDSPYIYADIDQDYVLTERERFTLLRGEEDKSYLLETIIKLPLPASTPFQSFPVLLQFYKDVRWDDLAEDERRVLQSKTAFARGYVDIQGRKTLVQYGFNPKSRKISATLGWVGVDSDGDGQIDMDRFSPEAAEARDETVVFRAGEHFVSTKKVDVEKNLIVLCSHSASDYKRAELRMGEPVPDFTFTDFQGKKRKLSDFRGKYVLIDFWAAWCPPCRAEMPYLKAAYKQFQSRGFEILGMDNDDDLMAVKAWLKKNDLNWTQATPDSIRDVMRSFRIHSFPTTMLIDPEGKIISLNQTRKGQPSLRGRELLKTLDKVLPSL
jgi:peroxiredoxin